MKRAVFVIAMILGINGGAPALAIPNENYKRTIQMVEGADVTQFTLTPVDGIEIAETVPAIHQLDKELVVLTPSKLYDLIEVEQKKSKIQTRILAAFQDRLKVLEENVKELERKIMGMQKQITILHAKKVNK